MSKQEIIIYFQQKIQSIEIKNLAEIEYLKQEHKEQIGKIEFACDRRLKKVNAEYSELTEKWDHKCKNLQKLYQESVNINKQMCKQFNDIKQIICRHDKRDNANNFVND